KDLASLDYLSRVKQRDTNREGPSELSDGPSPCEQAHIGAVLLGAICHLPSQQCQARAYAKRLWSSCRGMMYATAASAPLQHLSESEAGATHITYLYSIPDSMSRGLGLLRAHTCRLSLRTTPLELFRQFDCTAPLSNKIKTAY
ncbi:hypothetical protein KUCAC02_012195, partial [Chaenocephalus aceratus]